MHPFIATIMPANAPQGAGRPSELHPSPTFEGDVTGKDKEAIQSFGVFVAEEQMKSGKAAAPASDLTTPESERPQRESVTNSTEADPEANQFDITEDTADLGRQRLGHADDGGADASAVIAPDRISQRKGETAIGVPGHTSGLRNEAGEPVWSVKENGEPEIANPKPALTKPEIAHHPASDRKPGPAISQHVPVQQKLADQLATSAGQAVDEGGAGTATSPKNSNADIKSSALPLIPMTAAQSKGRTVSAAVKGGPPSGAGSVEDLTMRAENRQNPHPEMNRSEVGVRHGFFADAVQLTMGDKNLGQVIKERLPKWRIDFRTHGEAVFSSLPSPAKTQRNGLGATNLSSGLSTSLLTKGHKETATLGRSVDQVHPDAIIRTDGQSTAPQSISHTIPSRMEMPQLVSRQIAEALQHMPSRPVEITLSPEELGRVRLAVSSSENGIVVNVLAERTETIDLMRRNISSLESAFQAIGYNDIAFSFAGDGDAGSDTGPDQNAPTEPDLLTQTEATTAQVAQIRLRSGAANGLDIRL